MFYTSSGARACWRALVTIGAAIAALSCAPPSAEGEHGDAGTSGETVTASPELSVWVEPAVERWAAATGRSWVYAGSAAEDVGASFHISPGEPPPGYVAFAYGDGRVVVSRAWLSSPFIGTVLMHELGHAFRGDHHAGSGVMYYAIGDGVMTSCLTPADLVWACRDFACNDFAAECEQPVVAAVERPQVARCLRAKDRVSLTRPEPAPSNSGWLASKNVRSH